MLKFKLDDWQAADFFGEKAVKKRGKVLLRPVMGMEKLQEVQRVMAETRPQLLEKILRDLGAPERYIRKTCKYNVARVTSAGHAYMAPAYPGLSDAPLPEYAKTARFVGSKEALAEPDTKQRRLDMAQIFHDVDVPQAYGLSDVLVQALLREAVVDPAAAARSLTATLQARGYVNTVVVAGGYVKSKKYAGNCITELRKNYPRTVFTAEAFCQGDQLRIYYDSDGRGPREWQVMGPGNMYQHIVDVFSIACVVGPKQAMQLLALPTQMLGIEILNCKTNEYYNGVITGYSSMDGIEPNSACGLPSGLTAAQSSMLVSMGANVLPVRSGNKVVGSAVRVSGTNVVLNDHTLTVANNMDVVVEVAGERVYNSHCLRGDLVAIKRVGELYSPWLCRSAVVGERGVLIYSVGESVEYSEVVHVAASAHGLVTTTFSERLRKGASGAALVALSDGALLGLFSTMDRRSVVCSEYTMAALSVVFDSDHRDSGYHEGEGTVPEGLMERLRRRGLSPLLRAASRALAPLYAKDGDKMVFRGTMANYSGALMTTLTGQSEQLYDAGGAPVMLESLGRDMYCVEGYDTLGPRLVGVRAPLVGEEVVLLTRFGSQDAVSNTTVVTHVRDSTRFSLRGVSHDGITLDSAVVVAVSDAAVVGIRLTSSSDLFSHATEQCVAIAGFSYVAGAYGTRALFSEVDDWARTASIDDWDTVVQVAEAVVRSVALEVGYQTGASIGRTAVAVANWRDNAAAYMIGMGAPKQLWAVGACKDHDPYQVACACMCFMRVRMPQTFTVALRGEMGLYELMSKPLAGVGRRSCEF